MDNEIIEQLPLEISCNEEPLKEQYIVLLQNENIPFNIEQDVIVIQPEFSSKALDAIEKSNLVTEFQSQDIPPIPAIMNEKEEKPLNQKVSSFWLMILLFALVSLVVFGTDYIMQIIIKLFS